MTQLTTERSTDVIAAEINAIKYQTQTMMLQASAEIGKRLLEAKEQLPHGEWGNWLKENVEYSQSTANNLMQIHFEYGSNSQALGNLTYSKAVALLGIDAEERESFIQENNVEELSSRETDKLVKEKKKLEKEKAQLEEEAAKAEKALRLAEKTVQDLEDQLQQSRGDGIVTASDEEINRLSQELAVAQSQTKQLEAALKAKPIEAATVEVVPEEVQKELNQLRSKMYESADPAEVKFKILFESLIKGFNETIEAVGEIANNDTRSKYTNAIHKLMDDMRATLESGSE